MADAATRIFFSYARSDSEFVLKVATELRKDGRNVWVDQLDIPKGARWDDEVEKALKTSTCLLTVLSPASPISQNVENPAEPNPGELRGTMRNPVEPIFTAAL